VSRLMLSPMGLTASGLSTSMDTPLDPSCAAYVLQKEDSSAWLAYAAYLPKSQHRIAHGAVHKGGNDRVEALRLEGQVLGIHQHQPGPDCSASSPLLSVPHHLRTQIDREYRGPSGVVRDVLPRADTDLEDFPLSQCKRLLPPASEQHALHPCLHQIVGPGDTVVRGSRPVRTRQVIAPSGLVLDGRHLHGRLVVKRSGQ
jgi:hypothetical protein